MQTWRFTSSKAWEEKWISECNKKKKHFCLRVFVFNSWSGSSRMYQEKDILGRTQNPQWFSNILAQQEIPALIRIYHHEHNRAVFKNFHTYLSLLSCWHWFRCRDHIKFGLLSCWHWFSCRDHIKFVSSISELGGEGGRILKVWAHYHFFDASLDLIRFFSKVRVG